MLSNVVVGNEAVTINGDGLASGAQFAGSLRSIGTNTLGGKVTLGSDAKIFGGTGTSLTLDVVSGDGVNLASHNLTIDGAGASRIQDAIVGTGRLTKEGSGTLTLEGANTYTGGTTISAGTLKLQGGSVAGNITNNANLTITGGTELVNIISGNGSLTKADSGLSILWSSNSYTGATVVEAGSLRLDGSGSLSASTTLQVASGTLFSATGVFKTSNNLTLAGLTGAGEVFNKAGILTVNKSSGTDVFSGVISGGTGLTKSGAGNLRLSGINTYSNTTTVNAGVLEVASGGSIASSSATVNSGGTLDVDGTAGAVMVNNGGILMGSGTVSALTIASGGTLAVGNSPGTLTASSATWNGGGTYEWEISDFLGSTGTNWDFLNITGGLTISASVGNKFIIDVISLLAANNTDGDASNFNALANYSFAIATAAGGITGFDASYFDVQTAKFSNAMNPAGGWYVTQMGNSINLNYAAAIPEPSTGFLLLLGLATVFRRKKSSL
jgi:autotransporter-associated beta strand protein/autotransporter passenger strand-loop-strand repeat protein